MAGLSISVPSSVVSSKEKIHDFTLDYPEAAKLEAAILDALAKDAKGVRPMGITIECSWSGSGFKCTIF